MGTWNYPARLLRPSILLSLLGLAHTAGAQSYRLIDLGTLGGNESQATGINNAGFVAGYAKTTSGAIHAARWKGMTPIDLGPGASGGTNSYATGINNAGVVVGYAETASGSSHATRWNGTSPTDLSRGASDVDSAAYGVNDAGQVVGYIHTGSDFAIHATLWNGTIATDLGGPNTTSEATAINNAGVVVGDYGYGGPDFLGALQWNPNTTIPIELDNLGPISAVTGINDAGQVVAAAFTYNSVYRAELWNDTTTPTDLGPGASGGNYSGASGINKSGQVVGFATTSGDVASHATLWNGTVAIDLNTRINPALARYITLTEATAINDNGWIAANGVNSQTGRTEAYLLTPRPVPCDEDHCDEDHCDKVHCDKVHCDEDHSDAEGCE
jgi:probable HAF family extracellular repeat protein